MKTLRTAIRSLLSRTILRHNVVLPLVRGFRFVFVYHDISTPAHPHFHPVYSTRPEVFIEHLRVLSELFELVSLPALFSPRDSSRRNLASLAFDDGFVSVHREAAPILSARDIPFAIFVNARAIETGRLWPTEVILGRSDRSFMAGLFERYVDHARVSFDAFQREPLDFLVGSERLFDDYDFLYSQPASGQRLYMNRDEIRDLNRGGAIVGSHTFGHRFLSHLSDGALHADIEENRRYLESLIDGPIDHFAFPFGFLGTYDARALTMARANHRYLYSTERVCFTAAEAASDMFVVPRIGLRNEDKGGLLVAVNLPLFVNRQQVLYR